MIKSIAFIALLASAAAAPGVELMAPNEYCQMKKGRYGEILQAKCLAPAGLTDLATLKTGYGNLEKAMTHICSDACQNPVNEILGYMKPACANDDKLKGYAEEQKATMALLCAKGSDNQLCYKDYVNVVAKMEGVKWNPTTEQINQWVCKSSCLDKAVSLVKSSDIIESEMDKDWTLGKLYKWAKSCSNGYYTADNDNIVKYGTSTDDADSVIATPAPSDEAGSDLKYGTSTDAEAQAGDCIDDSNAVIETAVPKAETKEAAKDKATSESASASAYLASSSGQKNSWTGASVFSVVLTMMFAAFN